MRKFEIKRNEYERRVLEALRKELLEEEALVERESEIEIEDVRLDTSGSGTPHRVHILFRETSRPECLFGYWAEAAEQEAEPPTDSIVLSPLEGYWGPEDWASTILVTNFEEQVEAIGLGLPPDCDTEGITWINNFRRLPPERARKERPEMSEQELDLLHENWERTIIRLVSLLEIRGWFAFGSVGYSVTGSDRVRRDDFSYHVIAYRPAVEAIWRGEEPMFELFDEEHDVVSYVREVPTPEQAARLLEQHGISIEEADILKAMLPNVPDGVVRDL